MFDLNSDTGAITLPQGDTALFLVRLKNGSGEAAALPEGTAAVFGVCKTGSRGRTLLAKAFEVEGDAVVIRLTNQDTRELPPGTHAWDLRIVTDPDRDPETGEVRAYDPGDNVYSIFSGRGSMPQFVVTGVAANV